MYKALYRKYRPLTFDDMIGQEHIRVVLKRQCETGRNSHAYIFCGTRGTGKTTSAKILAKAVNCLSPLNGEPCGVCTACLAIESGTATDVLELDAASNNSVDDIRQLCDELIYPPTLLKKRVYIIDEVHMLSSSAYNALLKTLEEPPEHVLFILATTEINKIPPTVLSRCQRFEFKRLMYDDIARRLLFVSEKEGLRLTDEGASLIAKLADGSMRDGFSLLESCIEAADGGLIDRKIVTRQLGIAEDNTIKKLFEAAAGRNIASCLSLLDEYYNSAKSLSVLLDDMLIAVRDMLYIKQGGNPSALISNLDGKELLKLSKLFTDEQLIYFAFVTEEARNRLAGFAANKRLVAELALIRLCDMRFSDSPQALAARIAALEKKIALTQNVKTEDIPAQQSAEAEKEEDEKQSSINDNEVIPVDDTPYDMKSELLEQLSALPAVAKLLQKCGITAAGNRLYITASDSFTRDILKGETEAIKNAAKLAGGGECEIIITDKKHEIQKDESHINEIL
ncbi:MAG: DNA polymerase III subunit gamma/tau [Eubacteriales bacterium]|nr:DNA polymerase III subunit gamma/tau [Eubacteriales bacterium]